MTTIGRLSVVIHGVDLPGASWCDDGGTMRGGVHVGVQVRSEPWGLVAGDAPSARWDVEVDVVTGDDGATDFRGPAVHGKRNER